MVQFDASPIRLSDILALPPLVEAKTELLCGSDKLDAPIRWVHVIDTPRGGELIDGGELLMTTGTSLGTSESAQREAIQRFAAAGAAALLVEIGVHLHSIPEVVVQQCSALGMPLLITHGEVRFVEITEAVHSAILSQQFKQVEQLQRINESFWGLMFNGAPPEQLVTHASRELELPVILEDLNHRVVYYAEGHFLPSQLVSNWESRSRQWAVETKAEGLVADPVSVSDPDDALTSWCLIDIQAQDHLWGRLFVRGARPQDVKALHIMRHAAMALAIERLGSANPNAWTDLRERVGLERLLHNRFTTVSGQKTVLEASGFATTDRSIVAAELRTNEPVDVGEVRSALASISPDVQALIAYHEQDTNRVVCAISGAKHRHSAEELIDAAFARLRSLGVPFNFVVSAGLEGPIDLSAALHHIASSEVSVPHQGELLTWSRKNQFQELVANLHDDVRFQSYAEEILSPLLLHDSRNGTDLVQTLRAIVEYPASRSAAADTLHLSRTALYSRISAIERILDADLANGQSFFSLSVAVRSYLGK